MTQSVVIQTSEIAGQMAVLFPGEQDSQTETRNRIRVTEMYIILHFYSKCERWRHDETCFVYAYDTFFLYL